jgi:D-amino peptidase
VRVFVSVDMEGIAGVATLDQIIRGGLGYPAAQRLMTAETNAVVRAAFDAGATAVTVADSHGTMDNLVVADLDSRIRLVTGAPRASCMLHGLTADHDAVLFVGYHAPAGAEGVLAHTYSSNFTEIRVDGRPVSEADVNALHAEWLGVPVVLISGDDVICERTAKLRPDVTAVEVKRSHGFQSVDSLSPDVAAEALHRGVATALAGSPPPLERSDGPLRVAVDFLVPLYADLAQTVPGSLRTGGRTLERDVTDPAQLMQLIMAWYYLASIGAGQYATIAGRR